jgi:hypothetical protein
MKSQTNIILVHLAPSAAEGIQRDCRADTLDFVGT